MVLGSMFDNGLRGSQRIRKSICKSVVQMRLMSFCALLQV